MKDPGGDKSIQAKGLLELSQSFRARPSRKCAVISRQLHKVQASHHLSACQCKAACPSGNGSQEGPGSAQDALGRPPTYLLPKFYSKSS